MDETTFLVSLLADNWNAAITALGSDIPAVHRVRPQIMDIRSMDSTRNTTNPGRGGNRARISRAKDQDTNSDGVIDTADLIVCMEESQTIEYPTISWDVRNENYNMTISIRTLQDERGASDTNFARDRLENLYKVVRHRIEQNRKGATIALSDGESITMNQLFVGNRTESNDRNKRLFGYKLTADMKKYAVSIP